MSQNLFPAHIQCFKNSQLFSLSNGSNCNDDILRIWEVRPRDHLKGQDGNQTGPGALNFAWTCRLPQPQQPSSCGALRPASSAGSARPVAHARRCRGNPAVHTNKKPREL
eukprot:scaffold241170_cov15-Prasinocladus_malaysianus.AAC.1